MSHRCIVAVIVVTLVVAAGSADAAQKNSRVSILYERRVEAYQRQLATYRQQQSLLALRAAEALAAKLEQQRKVAIRAEALQRYRREQYLVAQVAAQRLSEKLERLYGPRHAPEAEVASRVRVVSAPVVATQLAAAPPAPKQAHMPPVPAVHRAPAPVRPPAPLRSPAVFSSLPTAPTWYGWGEL